MVQREPMLEFDTTHNLFRDEMVTEPLEIRAQIRSQDGLVSVPDRPGIGVEPDRAFLDAYRLE